MVKMKKHPVLGIMVRSDGLILHPGFNRHGAIFPEYWTKGCLWALGYYVVVIKQKRYKVHRLVAETFLENTENYPYVDHIDRNPSNNDVSNLRWASCRTNNLNRELVINARKRLGFDVMADSKDVHAARVKEWYNSEAGQKYYKEKYEKSKESK